MATEFPNIAGLVLISPYTSIAAIVSGLKFPVGRLISWLFTSRQRFFNSEAIMGDVRCPLLIAHGAKDGLIPLWHALALESAAVNVKPDRKQLHADPVGTHTELQYDEQVVRFVTDLLARRTLVDVSLAAEGGAAPPRRVSERILHVAHGSPGLFPLPMYAAPTVLHTLQQDLPVERAAFARMKADSRKKLLWGAAIAMITGLTFVLWWRTSATRIGE
jgi:hypothetical protein